MIIKVTAEDIQNGTPCHHRNCPIHLALKRATGKEFGVGLTFIQAENGMRLELPTRVSEWIQAYDMREKVGPFEFEL